jgi:inorganic triphosphatase YgiF
VNTEVEAKFSVSDAITFDRLLVISELDGYALRPARTAEVVDRYYDTAEAALLRGGYACRLRREGGQIMATVKGLGGAADGIHRRQELEVAVSGEVDPRAWPESPARGLVLSLTEDRPLDLLFELRQTRHRRQVSDGSRPVGLLSLDRVEVATGDETLAWRELEIELEEEGRTTDLQTLSIVLQTTFGLYPEPESKFTRALRWHQTRRVG